MPFNYYPIFYVLLLSGLHRFHRLLFQYPERGLDLLGIISVPDDNKKLKARYIFCPDDINYFKSASENDIGYNFLENYLKGKSPHPYLNHMRGLFWRIPNEFQDLFVEITSPYNNKTYFVPILWKEYLNT